jgi:hypothetical protein
MFLRPLPFASATFNRPRRSARRDPPGEPSGRVDCTHHAKCAKIAKRTYKHQITNPVLRLATIVSRHANVGGKLRRYSDLAFVALSEPMCSRRARQRERTRHVRGHLPLSVRVLLIAGPSCHPFRDVRATVSLATWQGCIKCTALRGRRSFPDTLTSETSSDATGTLVSLRPLRSWRETGRHHAKRAKIAKGLAAAQRCRKLASDGVPGRRRAAGACVMMRDRCGRH